MRAAAGRCFDVTVEPGGSLRIDRPEAPGGSAFVRLRIDADGERASLVRIEPHVELNLPFFNWAIRPLVGYALGRFARHVPIALAADVAGEPVPEPPPPPSFLPVGAFDERQASQLATTAAAAAIVGFASGLIGQLADPVQTNFHVSNTALGVGLAVTRAGALIALVVAGFADRQGRRRAILVGLALSGVASLASAVSPSFSTYIGAQLLQRAAVIATGVVAGIAAIEEAPESARAFAAAMLALAGGFGFTFAVLSLPIADLAPWAWRIAFAASGATLLLIPRIARSLDESSRYERLERTGVERGRVGEVFDESYGRRFAILAVAAFLLNVFSGPSSQFTNKYMTDVRHYSGAGIALWRGVTTGVPGIVGLMLAGPVSEVRGRRRVIRVGLVIGIATQMLVFLTGGVTLWLANTASAVAGAMGGVALGTVQAEMFPTEVRGTSNALLLIASVTGSAIGLVVAGSLFDSIGTGHALALCGTGALVAAAFLLPLLPESARRALDDVSPTEPGEPRPEDE